MWKDRVRFSPPAVLSLFLFGPSERKSACSLFPPCPVSLLTSCCHYKWVKELTPKHGCFDMIDAPCESALHQSLKLGTGSGRYRRIKPVLKSYNTQTEHFRGLSWALAMCGPHSYGTLSLAVPKQTQEAQTGSQRTPAGRYSVPSNKKDLLLSGWLLCAFQSAANKELDCVKPVQDGLNNKWKQTCFKNLPALGLFFSGWEWVSFYCWFYKSWWTREGMANFPSVLYVKTLHLIWWFIDFKSAMWRVWRWLSWLYDSTGDIDFNL